MVDEVDEFGRVVDGAVVEEELVGATEPSAVVVVASCFLPQSLRAASARLFFGWAETYSPWLRAFSQVTTLTLVVVVLGLVVEVVVVDVVESPMTMTPRTVVEVCALAPDTPVRTRDPATAAKAALLTMALIRVFIVVLRDWSTAGSSVAHDVTERLYRRHAV